MQFMQVIYYRFHPALCTVNEGSSEEQLWITGGNKHQTTTKAIDIYDGQSMTSHDLELPLDLYQHNLVQIKADLILLMGGLTGSSLTANTNYNIYVLGPPNCEYGFYPCTLLKIYNF